MACLCLFGCAAYASRPAADPPLLSSIQATTGTDSVYFLMQITNTGTRDVELVFSGGPAFYFTVGRDDLFLWNSAADSLDTASTTSETIRPGDTRSFHAYWDPPVGLLGTFTVTGVVQARDRPLVQSTNFRLP